MAWQNIDGIIADLGRMIIRVEELNDSSLSNDEEERIAMAAVAIEEGIYLLEMLADEVANTDGGYDV